MGKKWANYLYNLFFPNRCPGCNAFLCPEELVCEPCGDRMLLAHDAICHICGKVACTCGKRTYAYDKAVTACRYADETVSAVIRLKTSENTNFAYFSARILTERIQFSLNYDTPDCVMPVPMHPSKIRRRGYNQAALIAKEIAGLLDVPYREDVLYKNKSKKAQHDLNAAERQQNVASFGICDIPLDGMHILLCDDVLTTGSTMNRCAALLKQNGAAAVSIAAAATTIPHPTAPQSKEELL